VGADFANAVTVDAAGNNYITGQSDGDIGGTLPAGMSDIFLTRQVWPSLRRSPSPPFLRLKKPWHISTRVVYFRPA